MKPLSPFLFAVPTLLLMCMYSIGSVAALHDYQIWLMTPLMLWTTYVSIRALLRDAIATEAGTAETVKLGSVHEGASRRHRPDEAA